MKNATRDGDTQWDCGWDEHNRSQLLRLARLPFATKLEWLEEAEVLGLRLVAQSKNKKTRQDGE